VARGFLAGALAGATLPFDALSCPCVSAWSAGAAAAFFDREARLRAGFAGAAALSMGCCSGRAAAGAMALVVALSLLAGLALAGLARGARLRAVFTAPSWGVWSAFSVS
jgi:hypothetical protein